MTNLPSGLPVSSSVGNVSILIQDCSLHCAIAGSTRVLTVYFSNPSLEDLEYLKRWIKKYSHNAPFSVTTDGSVELEQWIYSAVSKSVDKMRKISPNPTRNGEPVKPGIQNLP